MRTNVYKKKILKVLEKTHLLSIADIHKKITDADYSTVYRNVEQLVAESQLRKIVLDKSTVMYELDQEKGNHDHFVCTDCGDVEAIEVPSEKLSLSRRHKVTDLLVRGLCGDCNQ